MFGTEKRHSSYLNLFTEIQRPNSDSDNDNDNLSFYYDNGIVYINGFHLKVYQEEFFYLFCTQLCIFTIIDILFRLSIITYLIQKESLHIETRL